MDVLVTYDVNTEDTAGRRRLRKVAIICKDFGQRVQFSVFECRVNEVQYEALCAKLRKIIAPDSDSLRIYKLQGKREEFLKCYGLDKYKDLDEPLVF